MKYFVKKYSHIVAKQVKQATGCSLEKVDAHIIARHPSGIKSIRLGRQVVVTVGGRACFYRMEHRHPEGVSELAIVGAWYKHIRPLPESGAGARVAPSAGSRWPHTYNSCVAELDF